MNLYEINSVEGVVLSVFAANFNDAAALFMAWHIANQEGALPDFEVRQRNPKWPGINTVHLLKALARAKPGIGQYDAGAGWEILSPTETGAR